PVYPHRTSFPHDALPISWTDLGGELLATEVQVMPGKGKLLITGRLGEVMQESAQAAMSYVRSRAEELGLERDFYQKIDIHIHIPDRKSTRLNSSHRTISY